MNVPGRIFASEKLIAEMDEKVREQVKNVACLPGIQIASMAMPDAHWGYGFPIGGVAAFDPDEGGIISMGGVGFDISCGVRTMKTGLLREEIMPGLERLVDQFYNRVPAGVGSEGLIKLNSSQIDEMLLGGAEWAVKKGYGVKGGPGVHRGARPRRRRRPHSGIGYCQEAAVPRNGDPRLGKPLSRSSSRRRDL